MYSTVQFRPVLYCNVIEIYNFEQIEKYYLDWQGLKPATPVRGIKIKSLQQQQQNLENGEKTQKKFQKITDVLSESFRFVILAKKNAIL